MTVFSVFITIYVVAWALRIICGALEDSRLREEQNEFEFEARRREAMMEEERKAYTPQKNGGWEAEMRLREFYRRQGEPYR